ncbi:protein YgfX [Uliginosibacterium sp. H1]|uniref:protein YgfX n=1 Tax=Uliginosibacterium sp. H1 TaxID=3114757 RepID=UPI003FCC7364
MCRSWHVRCRSAQPCPIPSVLVAPTARWCSARSDLRLAVSRHAPNFPPLRVSARFSFGLRSVAGVAHILPVVACLGSGVPGWVRAVVGLVVVVSASMVWRRVRAADALELEWLNGRRLRLHRAGITQDANVLQSSVDLGVCLVLVWEQMGGAPQTRRGRCVLTRGGVGQEAWRGLRARLRWDVAQASPSEGRRKA